MKVYLELITEFGLYPCEILDVSESQFMKLKEYTKTYYNEPFEAFLQSGDYLVIPPSVLQKSQLFIRFID